MKKFLLIYAMGATLLLIVGALIVRRTHNKNIRLSNNYEALTTEARLYKSRMEESAASVLALELELKEYKESHARDIKRIKALKVRPRRVESVAKAATQSDVAITTPLQHTSITQHNVTDSLPKFHWSDSWVSIKGTIRDNSLVCEIQSVDTIHQVVHRVPHRFLFVRYGTKAIRQEIVSSNPHTHIVYSEYVELPQKRKRRR